MSQLTISIGIAAYKAQKNIGHILESLLSQIESENFRIGEIIVHCDSSGDNTAAAASRYKSPKIHIISSFVRKGFGGSVKTLLQVAAGDVVVLLNDDIKITDNHFLSKLLEPFKNSNIGLVSGNPVPLPGRNFVEAAIISSIRAWDKMSAKIRGGNNIFTLDGKVLALSREFINQFEFPENLSHMGNVDVYLYLSCLNLGFLYSYASKSWVYCRVPGNLKDYVAWTIRNRSNYALLREQFGKLADREYKKPGWLYLRCVFWEFLKNPPGSLFIFATGFYIRHKARDYALKFSSTWDVISTSKNLKTGFVMALLASRHLHLFVNASRLLHRRF